MAEIEEIPIEVEGAVSAEPSVSSIEVKPPEAPAPKKRGRPKGSTNKPKPKARPPTPESDEETPDPPPVRRRRNEEPTPREDSVSPEPPDTRAIAAEVLHLLSNRHVERTNAKREKYRSWFQ